MRNSTVLTVISDKEFLSLLRLQLHDQVARGSRMIAARTIEEACSLLETVRPRLVVVDGMGESARYDQFAQLLWATTVQARRIPVLVIADRYCSDQATMLFRMGVSEYISRTHHLDELGRVFAAYLPQMPKVSQYTFPGVTKAVKPAKARTSRRVSQTRVARAV